MVIIENKKLYIFKFNWFVHWWNKTKYFVLRRFDELCSEYNEVNEEADSKRGERECWETVEIIIVFSERLLRDCRRTGERLPKDCQKTAKRLPKDSLETPQRLPRDSQVTPKWLQRYSKETTLTLKRPRLADWHEFARLTQGNSLASVLQSAFWAQDGGFNHSDDMQGSGQTCTTHKNQQELSEKANNEQ